MIDCPVCKAQCENVMRRHDERMMAIYEGHAERVASLQEKFEWLVMHQAEWRREQLEVIEKLHAEHVGGGDA